MYTFVLGLEELAFSSHAHCYRAEVRGVGVRVHDELVGHVMAVDLVRHKPTAIIGQGTNLLYTYIFRQCAMKYNMSDNN